MRGYTWVGTVEPAREKGFYAGPKKYYYGASYHDVLDKLQKKYDVRIIDGRVVIDWCNVSIHELKDG